MNNVDISTFTRAAVVEAIFHDICTCRDITKNVFNSFITFQPTTCILFIGTLPIQTCRKIYQSFSVAGRKRQPVKKLWPEGRATSTARGTVGQLLNACGGGHIGIEVQPRCISLREQDDVTYQPPRTNRLLGQRGASRLRLNLRQCKHN